MISSEKMKNHLPEPINNDLILGFLHLPGESNVILSAPHAQGPKADTNTGEIAFRAALITKSHALISTISRKKLDLNYPSIEARNSAYRRRLKEITAKIHKRSSSVLILDIHGMKSSEETPPAICVGTLVGLTADEETLQLVMDSIEEAEIQVCWPELEAPSLIGGDITASSGKPKSGIQAIQLEFDSQLREQETKEAIQVLVKIIEKWQQKNPRLWGSALLLQLLKGAYPIESKSYLYSILKEKCDHLYWWKDKALDIDEFVSIFPEDLFPIKDSTSLLKGEIAKRIKKGKRGDK